MPELFAIYLNAVGLMKRVSSNLELDNTIFGNFFNENILKFLLFQRQVISILLTHLEMKINHSLIQQFQLK